MNTRDVIAQTIDAKTRLGVNRFTYEIADAILAALHTEGWQIMRAKGWRIVHTDDIEALVASLDAVAQLPLPVTRPPADLADLVDIVNRLRGETS